MKITDDLEWNFEKCLNRFNSMGSLYKISNFVKSWDFPSEALGPRKVEQYCTVFEWGKGSGVGAVGAVGARAHPTF